AWLLSDLRNGTRTEGADRGRDGQPGASGHDPPFLGRSRAVDPTAGDGDGGASLNVGWCFDRLPPRRLDSTGAWNSGSGLVRLAVFPARLGLDHQPPPQYVQSDRARNGRGLRIQRGRGGRAADFPGLLSRSAWRDS